MSNEKLSKEQIHKIVEETVKKELPQFIDGFKSFIGLAVLMKEAEKEKKGVK